MKGWSFATPAAPARNRLAPAAVEADGGMSFHPNGPANPMRMPPPGGRAAARLVSDLLPEIPLIEVGALPALELIRAEPARTAALIEAAQRRYSRVVVALTDRSSRRWLERTGNPYLAEIRAVAETVGLSGAYMLNLSHEWACTTGVASDPAGRGERLVRVLDWPLDGLGRHVVIARHDGPAGPWFNPTWPGFAGVLTAAAPGRFAAAFNQAPLRRRTPFVAADWLLDRIAIAGSKALPPAHLLRQVFEQARDYREARERILQTPLCIPALFALSGTAEGEGCVIERLEHRAILHDQPVAVANHWLTTDLGPELPRGDLSVARREQLQALLAGEAGADFDWLLPPVRNDFTRLVVIANAATGEIAVQGWEASGPATAIRRLHEPPV